ncbi:hypothetical protein T439DRAFT_138532 [Meredithblackwellia eburnea MCA 4105]
MPSIHSDAAEYNGSDPGPSAKGELCKLGKYLALPWTNSTCRLAEPDSKLRQINFSKARVSHTSYHFKQLSSNRDIRKKAYKDEIDKKRKEDPAKKVAKELEQDRWQSWLAEGKVHEFGVEGVGAFPDKLREEERKSRKYEDEMGDFQRAYERVSLERNMVGAETAREHAVRELELQMDRYDGVLGRKVLDEEKLDDLENIRKSLEEQLEEDHQRWKAAAKAERESDPWKVVIRKERFLWRPEWDGKPLVATKARQYYYSELHDLWN